MKIIVNDYVYVEYGLEREIVNKALDEYKVFDDPYFKNEWFNPWYSSKLSITFLK